MPIINSLLDTDLYKLTMWQVALHQYATTHVTYEFKCRNQANWTEEILKDINGEIDHYCTLKFSKEELKYLEVFPFFKSGFLNFLSVYEPNRDHVKVSLIQKELHISVTGPWFLTIPFEVPILSIVNEVYFRHQKMEHQEVLESAQRNLQAKKAVLAPYTAEEFTFADFGTRRRFSREWQETVVKELSQLKSFSGTSNVDLARRFNLKPIGTMAHEFLMIGQALDSTPLAMFQQKMLQSWVDEFRGDLGIALTDTVGIDAFLRDFDKYFAKLYDGLRHDSGDPLWWAEKVINHYKKLNLDPRTKTLVFSDGLTPAKAVEIYNNLKGKAKISFGIGTNFTNDIPGQEPLQIVMKIVKANGKPVAKVSDSPGKGMCHDQGFLDYLKKVYQIS